MVENFLGVFPCIRETEEKGGHVEALAFVERRNDNST